MADSGRYITIFLIEDIKAGPLLNKGIENATALSTLLTAAARDIQVDGQQNKNTNYLRADLEIYATSRREQASSTVENSSLFVGELLNWQT